MYGILNPTANALHCCRKQFFFPRKTFSLIIAALKADAVSNRISGFIPWYRLNYSQPPGFICSNIVTMQGNKTLTMIKPDAVKKGYTGKMLEQITNAGFRISAIKMLQLSIPRAELFYAIHRERPFYNDLVHFMASGPVVAAILEKDHAVEDFRTLIGPTDPSKATPETIRARFGSSVQNNAIHGSDSDDNATMECDFFFSQLERY